MKVWFQKSSTDRFVEVYALEKTENDLFLKYVSKMSQFWEIHALKFQFALSSRMFMRAE